MSDWASKMISLWDASMLIKVAATEGRENYYIYYFIIYVWLYIYRYDMHQVSLQVCFCCTEHADFLYSITALRANNPIMTKLSSLKTCLARSSETCLSLRYEHQTISNHIRPSGIQEAEYLQVARTMINISWENKANCEQSALLIIIIHAPKKIN